jgi:hypothetical protein
MNDVNMEVKLAGIRLKNPVMAASGTFGFGDEYRQFYDISKLGAVVVKGLTLKPRIGNPPPRVAETPAGMLNSVGLQNPGIDYFIETELPRLIEQGVHAIANISGNTIDEYCISTNPGNTNIPLASTTTHPSALMPRSMPAILSRSTSISITSSKPLAGSNTLPLVISILSHLYNRLPCQQV